MEKWDRNSTQSSLTESAKERIKLRSNWLNGLSIATFAVGTLASTTRAVFDSGLGFWSTVGLFILALVCLFIAWILHLRAYRNLKELDE